MFINYKLKWHLPLILVMSWPKSSWSPALSLYKCGLVFFPGFICTGVYAFGRQPVCFICAVLMLGLTPRVYFHTAHQQLPVLFCILMYKNWLDTDSTANNKHQSSHKATGKLYITFTFI